MTQKAFLSWATFILPCVTGMLVVTLALGIVPRIIFGQTTLSSSPMRIGIIGSGNIGSTVGTLWVKAGHQVMFSSRNPGNLKQLVDGLGPLARAGTVAEALAFGDVVFVGVPYGAMPQLGKDYAKEFSGKIVLDAGNAVVARDGEIGKAAREAGVALTSAKLLAGARIVRAFNTINFRRLANLSNRPEGRIAIPMAGDDQEALKIASLLVRDAGFDPVVLGGLERSKLFEQGGPLYGQEISAQEMRERVKALK